MTKAAKPADDSALSDTFLDALEKGVRDVIGDKKSKASERVAAIAAGVKIAFVRHKISGNDERGFFE
jgi:hypothetical protein